MNTTGFLFVIILFLTIATTTLSSRSPIGGKPSIGRPPSNNKDAPVNKGTGGKNDGGYGGFFGPGGGFGIPGFGNIGGGYGSGFGSPSGGHSKGGIVRGSAVCKEKGPCYNKKLTCPAKCYTSYSRSGKNYGFGGGGGGCTMDCKKKCVAYC